MLDCQVDESIVKCPMLINETIFIGHQGVVSATHPPSMQLCFYVPNVRLGGSICVENPFNSGVIGVCLFTFVRKL